MFPFPVFGEYTTRCTGIDGNSIEHYGYRSREGLKIACIATATVVVRPFFRLPYYAYRSYPALPTTAGGGRVAFLSPLKLITGGRSFSLYAPRGNDRAVISSLPHSSSACHVKANRLHLFGRAPFRVSTIRPASNKSRLALFSVSSDFQPRGCISFHAMQMSPLLSPRYCAARSSSNMRAWAFRPRYAAPFSTLSGNVINPPPSRFSIASLNLLFAIA